MHKKIFITIYLAEVSVDGLFIRRTADDDLYTHLISWFAAHLKCPRDWRFLLFVYKNKWAVNDYDTTEVFVLNAVF